jgi:hypothetical protein
LTFYWVDQDNQVLFDPEDNITNEILNFIDEALENGESCLVHSIRGQSRASVALSVYFMQKYRWSLYKTLEFLNSRRPDLEIRAAFVSQLADFEQKLITQNRGPQTGNWNEVADANIILNQDKFYPNEELILRNTFLNAHLGANKSFNTADQLEYSNENSNSKTDLSKDETKKDKLKWIDDHKDDKSILRTNKSEDDLVLKDVVEPIQSHKNKKLTKSIIKHPKNIVQRVNPKEESKFVKSNERSFHKTEKIEKQQKVNDDKHSNNFKQKKEPLIVNEIDDLEEEFEVDLPKSNTKEENLSHEKFIEHFNTGATNKKYFVPRKDPKNNTEPIDLKKRKIGNPITDDFLKNINAGKNPNNTQKFVVKKEGDRLKATSIQKEHNDSQKDVIVRRIKKKNENNSSLIGGKEIYTGFGHKKSNSEMNEAELDKKRSFQNIRQNQLSVNFDPNRSLKRPKPNPKGEFKSQNYKKALDKFQEFKKEQELVRKNTPITKFRKGSAKKVSFHLTFRNVKFQIPPPKCKSLNQWV